MQQQVLLEERLTLVLVLQDFLVLIRLLKLWLPLPMPFMKELKELLLLRNRLNKEPMPPIRKH